MAAALRGMGGRHRALATYAQRHLAAAGARPSLRGVVFDMDGTLTKPNLDFSLMYKRCGVALDKDILAEVEAMAPEDGARATAIIEEMEAEGAATLELMPGAADFARWLHGHDVPIALVTRNSHKTLQTFYERLWLAQGLPEFSPAISRDGELRSPSMSSSSSQAAASALQALPSKPDPAAMMAIAGRWEVPLPSAELLMVGDSPSNDVAFGKAAGTATVLLDTGRRFNEAEARKKGHDPDYCVGDFHELPQLLSADYELVGSR
eukprot:TRINITY_DN73671_c0_g1_i1.p1 TRINITY_DN73671_c0_g1~~TRINITY_DN73671_c0_g1_i1.p1  ORF type:complete len:287 (+),score=49.53 TRINITY_DN73671_c0_g1_i1:70-861(+)